MKSDTHGGAAVAPVNGRHSAHYNMQLRNHDAPSSTEFGKLQFHPLVLAFPTLTDEQLESMAEDIRARGSPTLLKRGEVILGDFNVVAACERAGAEVKYAEWNGSGSLAEVVARSVMPAAHLSESQRAAIAVAISDQVSSETVASGINAGRANLRNAGPKTAIPANGSVAAQCAATEDDGILRPGDRVTLRVPNSVEGYIVAVKRDPSPYAFIEWDLTATEPASAKKSRGWAGFDQLRKIADNGEEKHLGRAAEIAAQLCQVSARYVYEARKLRDADRALFDLVRNGQMNLSRARVAVSRMSREKALTPLNGKATKRYSPDDDLIIGDCLEKMAKLADGIFPLVFADPPYNLGWKYHADPTCDLLPDAKYLEWTERWIKHCVRLLTADGSIFVMIDGKWQGRFDVILRNAGLHHRNTIVWHDTFPTHTDARFQPAARFIHYFSRSSKNFTFNADAIRVPSRRDEIADGRRVHVKGIVPHDVWGGDGGGGGDISRIQGNNPARVPFDDAPPQVPEKILERIILASSNAGDRVFDPFTGNGTTWKAARKLGRKFTGIERSPKYAAQARQWAESV